MNEELPLTAEYKDNLQYIVECENNTKNITDTEMELIFEECGCNINYVGTAANFDFENEKYEIQSCYIINGGEGEGICKSLTGSASRSARRYVSARNPSFSA